MRIQCTPGTTSRAFPRAGGPSKGYVSVALETGSESGRPSMALSVVDAAWSTAAHRDRVAVDGSRLGRTKEDDDVRNLAGIDEVMDRIAGCHLLFDVINRDA